MDALVFVEGLIRSSVWIFGVWASYHARTRLSFAGCILAVGLSTTNALILAGAWMPSKLASEVLVALGGLTSGLLVAAIVSHRTPGATWSN